MATARLDRLAIFLAAGTGGFCLGAWLAPAMVNQRIQWETLATDVLAIAAAAWSVRAAMRLDREQERRHNDTQRLTLRADRASAARAAYLAGEYLLAGSWRRDGVVKWGMPLVTTRDLSHSSMVKPTQYPDVPIGHGFRMLIVSTNSWHPRRPARVLVLLKCGCASVSFSRRAPVRDSVSPKPQQ
jgi:hypothetical protein